jgi:arylsulfatase
MSTQPGARPDANTSRGASPRPNVVLILADDLGFSDIGCYGAEIRTPNLDQLAAGGLVFSQACNCARCCPSRAALLTGLYPHQAGVGHMVHDLGRPAYQGYLRRECVTLGEVLREAGYRTLYSGKWHTGGFWSRRPQHRDTWTFGDPKRPLPTDRGFDRYYGSPTGAHSYFNALPLIEQDRILEAPEGFYTTDSYTDAAIGMVGEAVAQGRPFFLHLCYNAPHWPLHAWPEDIARYRGKYLKGWDAVRAARHEELKGRGLLSSRWAISPRDEQAPAWEGVANRDWEDARMSVYAAQIDRMDRNIGRLLARLDGLGALGNTLVIFVSDNGGCAEFLSEDGQRQKEAPFTRDGRPMRLGNNPAWAPGPDDTYMSYGLPWANASNSPFRLFKSWVHEGGIATPMVVSWPDTIRAAGVVHEPCHFVDVAATIIEASGARYPREFGGTKITALEGESFARLFRGRSWRRARPIFFEHQGNCAVREGRWKLVRRFPGPWELYDMSADRTELTDLSATYPDEARRLGRLYDDWAARCEVAPWEQVRRRK